MVFWMKFSLSILFRSLCLLSKFVFMLYLAKTLPVVEVGTYGIVTTTIILALQIIGIDFYSYNTRELLKVNVDKQVVYIRDQWCVHLLTYVVFLPFFLLLFKFHVLSWSLLLWFYILLVLEHNAQEIDRLLVTLSMSVMANVVMFLRFGAWMLILMGLGVIGKVQFTLSNVWLAWIVGDVCALLLALWQLRALPWRQNIFKVIDFAWIKRGIKVSLIFLAGTIFLQLLIYMNRYIIQYVLGLEAVGIYVFFAGLLGVILTFAQVGIYNFQIPLIIKRYHMSPNTLSSSIRKLYLLVGGYLVVAVVGAAAGIQLVLLLLNKQIYADQIHIFYILLVGTIIAVLGQVPHYGLYIHYHEKLLLKISIIVFIISLILNFCLIKQYGLLGAAFANIISLALLGGIKHYKLVKIQKKREICENSDSP